MPYDFNEAMKYSEEVEVTVKGNVYPGVLIQTRVNPDSIPKEYHTYYLREWDSAWPDDAPCACEIKNGFILVNYLGIFCTKEELPLKEGESFEYKDGLDISFNQIERRPDHGRSKDRRKEQLGERGYYYISFVSR